MAFSILFIIIGAVFVAVSITAEYELIWKVIASLMLIAGFAFLMWYEDRLLNRIIELENYIKKKINDK